MKNLGRAVVPLIAVALLLGLLPGVAAAATRPTTFDLYIGSNCLDGFSSDNARVKVVWRSASGVLKLREELRAGSSGGWWQVCAQLPRVLKTGDTIKATVGSTTRKLTVPRLTLNPDRVNDVFKGRAPAGSTIRLTYQGGIIADFDVTKKVRVRSDGTWRYSPPGFDIMGGLYSSMRWTSPKNDGITVDRVAPYLVVTLGRARFKGNAKPTITVKASLKDALTAEVRAVGKAAANLRGAFSGRFRNSQGKRVPLKAGLRLVAPKVAADAKWIVPRIRGSANAATDVVSGRCFDAGTSERFVWVNVISPRGSNRGWAHGGTTTNGSFEVDFSGSDEGLFFQPANIRSGDTIEVRCLQNTGDWVQLRFPAP